MLPCARDPAPALSSMRRRLRLLLALLLAPAALGCGHDAPPAGSGARKPAEGPATPAVDRATPEVVLVAAHRALSAGDLAALRPHLTDAAYEHLVRDLATWKPPPSRLPADPARREAITKAIASGDPAQILRAYVEVEPRLPLPPPPAVERPPDVARAQLTMPARDGETRLVRFARATDGWRIDRLQL